MRLLPQDYAFIELVQEEISEHCAIPLEIKPNKIVRIIKEAAKYFYEWHPQAIERKHLMIKYSDIKAARTDGMNSKIKLPSSVKFIFKIRQGNSGIVTSEARYLRNPNMGLARFGSIMGTQSGIGSTLGGGMVARVMAMHEYQSFNNISSATKGVAHGWSEISSEITFLGEVNSDLFLECGIELPTTDLYNDRLFLEYVKGQALISLSRIIGTYDFKLTGNVTINYSDLKADGQDMITAVKEELQTYNTNNFLITK